LAEVLRRKPVETKHFRLLGKYSAEIAIDGEANGTHSGANRSGGEVGAKRRWEIDGGIVSSAIFFTNNGYIVKPFTHKQLAAALNDLLKK
jgi:hypothetical protein